MRSLLYGCKLGLVVAGLLTLVVTYWDWFANPGGIFHSSAGTNWPFVAETALSWFLPTWALVSAAAVVVHWLWLKLRKR